MKNSLLTILSRHQIIVSSALIAVFLASGAFFSTKYLSQQIATVTEGKCALQSEVDAESVQLSILNTKVVSIEAEIKQAEDNIVANSSSNTSANIRIEELKTLIQSDYAISLENENVNRLCSGDGESETVECITATNNYKNLVKDNNAKKEELRALEAKQSDPNTGDDSHLVNLLSEKKGELDNVNTQISDITQAITFGEANLCSGVAEDCSNTDQDGSAIDDNRDGFANCADGACSGDPSCITSNTSNEQGAVPAVDDANGAGKGPDLPLPIGDSNSDPSLFPADDATNTPLPTVENTATPDCSVLAANINDKIQALSALQDMMTQPEKNEEDGADFVKLAQNEAVQTNQELAQLNNELAKCLSGK